MTVRCQDVKPCPFPFSFQFCSDEVLFFFNCAFVIKRFKGDSIVNCKEKPFSPASFAYLASFLHQIIAIEGVAKFSVKYRRFEGVAHREVEAIDTLPQDLHVTSVGTKGD